MLNAMAWSLACFGVVAADIALGMVLFSALDIVSALTGFPIDNLDIQWFQAAAQTASFLMALLWWRYCGGATCGPALSWRAGKVSAHSAGEQMLHGSASPALS